MKRWSMMLPFVAGAALAAFVLFSKPSQTTACYLPCYVCHGIQFAGSDLAPSVADTKLTDAEIIRQIASPRGVMPAFPEFANQNMVDYIRTMPTGQPTASLSPEQRSEALATIAAVAATRSVEFARLGQSEAGATPFPTPVVSTSTPVPVGSAAATTAPEPSPVQSLTGPGREPASIASIHVFTLTGGLLAVISGGWLAWQRRKAQRRRE